MPAAAVAGVPAAVGSIGQQITVAVNTTFNALFSQFPGSAANPVLGLAEGALVVLRRTVFGLVPTGVTASLDGSTLVIKVDPGSTAYFRQNGTSLQVSGDPAFFHVVNQQEFTAPSVQTVTATNTGGGHAGLVFTSGDVNAALETTGIDSLNFGAGAQFEGSVSVDATASAALVLYNAVRGMAGVTLDAPVIRLATDVSVEAASLTGTAPDVRFTGTVDATSTGAQSLAVTALGTTTFEKAVGSLAALGSLITRGIAPLSIPQSSDSQTMPLYFMPIYSATVPGAVKTGIPVAIGENPSQFYTFDGGGDGFTAGYSPSFWNGVPLVGPPAEEGYGADTQSLKGVAVTTPITIGETGNSVTTGPIRLVAGLENNPAGYTNPNAGPFDGRFYGDFGVSFAYNNSAPGLTSAMWQLPGTLANGFLVQLGPIGTQGQLTVGAPQVLLDQFSYAVTIPVATDPAEPNYPVSGFAALEKGINGIYTVTCQGTAGSECSHPGQPVILNDGKPIPTVLDTGNNDTWVKGVPSQPGCEGCTSDEGGTLAPGSIFSATFTNALTDPNGQPLPDLVWSFVVGKQQSVNVASYKPSGSSAGQYATEVNAGLNIYNHFDVLFNAKNQLVYLRPNGGQSTVILKSSVKTTGAQSYQQGNVKLNGTYTTTEGGAVSVAGTTALGGDTRINAGSGAVTFSGTVDGAPDSAAAPALTVNTSGATTFVRAVGWVYPLASLTTTGGGTTATWSVTTNGSQTYGGDVSINGPYWVYGTSRDGASAFTVAGSTMLAGPTSLNTCGKQNGAGGRNGTVGCSDSGIDVTFNGPVDSLANKGFPLTVAAGDNGVVEFKGAVGGANSLGGLAIDSAKTVTASGTVSLDGGLGYASGEGLQIGSTPPTDGTDSNGKVGRANFAGGGSIVGFRTDGGPPNGACSDQRKDGVCGSGVVVNGTPSGLLRGFTIANNASYGIYVTDKPLSLTETDNYFIGNVRGEEGPRNEQ